MAFSLLAALFVTAAFVSPLLPLADPNSVDLGNRLAAPLSSGHLLGTDLLGRDMLSRLLAGTRTSVLMASGATIFSMVAGTMIGVLAAFLGGRVDSLLILNPAVEG